MDMSKAYQAGVTDYCLQRSGDRDKVSTTVAECQQSGGPSAVCWFSPHRRPRRQGRLAQHESMAQRKTRRTSRKLTGAEPNQDKNLCTAKAYQMRLVLQDIYRSANVATARHRFKVLCRWVRLDGALYKVGIFYLDADSGQDELGTVFGRNPGLLEMGHNQRVLWKD